MKYDTVPSPHVSASFPRVASWVMIGMGMFGQNNCSGRVGSESKSGSLSHHMHMRVQEHGVKHFNDMTDYPRSMRVEEVELYRGNCARAGGFESGAPWREAE